MSSGAVGVLEVEVLELGADVEVEAHVGGALELAAQDPARVALVRLVVAVEDVAEDERRLLWFCDQGSTLKVAQSGIATMSDSSISA